MYTMIFTALSKLHQQTHFHTTSLFFWIRTRCSNTLPGLLATAIFSAITVKLSLRPILFSLSEQAAENQIHSLFISQQSIICYQVIISLCASANEKHNSIIHLFFPFLLNNFNSFSLSFQSSFHLSFTVLVRYRSFACI